MPTSVIWRFVSTSSTSALPARTTPKAAPPSWRNASRCSKGGKPVKLPAHNRYDYVPIHKRPQYEWPEGARLAVAFCNNIEYFAFGAGLGADPSGTPTPQSYRNYVWRDYGNRV